MDSLRGEIDALRNQLYSARTAQLYTRLQGPQLGMLEVAPSVNPPVNLFNGGPPTAIPPAQVVSRGRKGRFDAIREDPSKIQTLNEQEWERMQQAHVLANVQHAFSSSSSSDNPAASSGYEGEGPMASSSGSDLDQRRPPITMVFPPMQSSPKATGLLSPGHQDAQQLAMMLQEQLDAINTEIR